MTCLLCEGHTALVVNLGTTPLANRLLNSAVPRPTEYPLKLVQCQACRHLQLSLDSLVPKELLYVDYPYTSAGANDAHLRELASTLAARFRPTNAIDVGSNDGTFLSALPESVSKVGVEPDAELAAKSHIELGIPIVHGFFGEDCFLEQGNADLITAFNVFAHNADLGPMLRAVHRSLSTDGVFVLEVTYAPAMLRSGAFDLIYHEHIHHWHMRPMVAYLRRHGLEPFDAELVDTHGGSLRVYARKTRRGRPALATSIESLCETEADLPTQQFGVGIRASIDAAERLLGERPFWVYGWPAKATTLFGVWGDHVRNNIQAVFEDNKLKVGRLTPYGHPIVSSAELASRNPSKLLVASWNYADAIMARHPEYGGRWLIPIPTLRAL